MQNHKTMMPITKSCFDLTLKSLQTLWSCSNKNAYFQAAQPADELTVDWFVSSTPDQEERQEFPQVAAWIASVAEVAGSQVPL